jgi:putative phosphoesterase
MMKKRGVNNRSDMNREVYVVGVIADTHGLVRPGVAAAFAGVDLILHAGDVGGPAVYRALAALAPIEAVYGNVDDRHDPSLARERTVTIGGVTIHVSHGHELGRPTPELALARYRGDVVIFGHTHKSIVVHDGAGRIGMNPGAAGPRRFSLPASVARVTIRTARSDPATVALQGAADPVVRSGGATRTSGDRPRVDVEIISLE